MPIDDVKNVDLLFMVDNSGSMQEEQEKLRAEFPGMITALLTGQSGTHQYPPVQSLRVAVVTSDLGVAGVGFVPNTTSTKISSCGGTNAERAHYGDDGAFRLQGRSAVSASGVTTLDCDLDDDGTDDSVTAAALPDFLTFDAGGTVPMAEYLDRVSCYANTGTDGCAYEQQLESVLKALTPSDAAAADALPGGRFYYQTDDATDHSARGLGQGTDTLTVAQGDADDAANGGWLRDDSLLAVVLVTDEDDCSSKDPRVFDFLHSAEPAYDDAYDQFQAQTRCARHPELTFDTDRYVRGLLELREGRENLLVFGAITGVPAALTDGDTNAGTTIIEGTTNIADIVADPFMQYVFEEELRPAGPGNANIWVPASRLRPACQHVAPNTTYSATADVADGSNTLNDFVATPRSGTSFSATGNTTSGSDVVTITSFSSDISAGMSITATGIATGTTITLLQEDVVTPGQYFAHLSEPATATGAGVTLTIGASFGPAIGQQVTSTGNEIPYATTITGVSGTNPYTVTLSQRAVGTTTGLALELGMLDVSATPAVRAAAVAQGLRDASGNRANVTLQSICVDDFGPAMGEILRLIQTNLAGSCLPHALNRNAANKVTCDVFITMPPNVDCDPAIGYSFDSTLPTTDPSDTDHVLQRCRLAQLPVTLENRSVTLPDGGISYTIPSGEGWFYDDYTSELEQCGSLQRISFTEGAKPPQGSSMKYGCIQPVQDHNLVIDLNAACTSPMTPCSFGSDPAEAQAAYSEFRLRYNLEPRGWGDAIPVLASSPLQLQCEPNSLTCQIPCTNDANCPGGFVCYDPSGYDPILQSYPYCANPICGTGM